MITLTANPVKGQTGLWFDIPRELQHATSVMLCLKLTDIREGIERANAAAVIYDAARADVKYTDSIWEVHGLVFYAKYGIWRVGCGRIPAGMTEESILTEIKTFDVIDVETRVVPEPLLLN